MMHPLSCSLCGHFGLTVALELSGTPRWNHRLLRQDEVATDRAVELTAHQCSSCGFVSVPMRLSSDYYDDYVNAPSLSPQAQRFQLEQAQDFVGRFALSGKKVLEVGCGDGFFLQSLKGAGADCFGIEPSSAQRDLACARGLRVESGILSAGRKLPDAPFDAFVTRQVLEHIEDMRDFLLTIRGNLAPGAFGLVEVPNLDKIREEGRFFDFIPEHINYFTPRSLSLVMQLAGFQALEVCPVQEGESLRVLVRWDPLPDCSSIASRIDSLKSDISSLLAECALNGKKVAIWGAGGKGLSLMAVSDLRSVKLLVDSDPLKAGFFTPVSHLRVESPQELARQGIDVVIVMAPAYELEIARTLRDELGFTGGIVLAGRGVKRLEPVEDVH